MLASTPRNSHPNASRRAARLPVICVVDPNAGDYRPWLDQAAPDGPQVTAVRTAAEALRTARTSRIDRWVINTSLPDLAGSELCEMLRSRSPSVPIALVSEEYSGALECEAYRARATLFSVKPAHLGWLAEWLDCNQPHTAKAAV